MKIVQIDGIKGLITAGLIGCGLFAGFVISPGYLMMSLWNKYLVLQYAFPTLNLLQGVLLWGIVVVSYCILTKNQFAVSLKNSRELTDAEISSIIKNSNAKTIDIFKNKKNLDIKKEILKNDKESSLLTSSLNLKNIENNDIEEKDKITK